MTTGWGLPVIGGGRTAFRHHQSGSTQRMAVLLAVSVVMGLAAVAAVVWTLTALWIILIPAAMITLILAVQIEE